MKRINRENRIKAYKSLHKLKEKKISRRIIVKKLSKRFRISSSTLYVWYAKKQSPLKIPKPIKYDKDLFYILGALLGDGCAYHWKKKDHYLINIVGEKEFINKYAIKASHCLNRNLNCCFYKSKYLKLGCKVWFVNVKHHELYILFKSIKKDLNKLINLMKKGDFKENSLEYLEGFFDAEGCVKIIKEPVRITPKICLDICCTNYELLEIYRKLLDSQLNIKSRYSIQKHKKHWKGNNKKTVYHLRIYKKEYIKRFLENIKTIKLKPEKAPYVRNWLNNGK